MDEDYDFTATFGDFVLGIEGKNSKSIYMVLSGIRIYIESPCKYPKRVWKDFADAPLNDTHTITFDNHHSTLALIVDRGRLLVDMVSNDVFWEHTTAIDFVVDLTNRREDFANMINEFIKQCYD